MSSKQVLQSEQTWENSKERISLKFIKYVYQIQYCFGLFHIAEVDYWDKPSTVIFFSLYTYE